MERFLDLIKQKNSLLEEMLEQTAQRNLLNEPGQAEQILDRIEARQHIIEKIGRIDSEVKVIYPGYDGGEEKMPPSVLTEEGTRVLELIEKERRRGAVLAGRIMELDRILESRLKYHFQIIKAERAKLSAGRLAYKAYTKKSSVQDSIFIDKRKK